MGQDVKVLGSMIRPFLDLLGGRLYGGKSSSNPAVNPAAGSFVVG